MFFPKDSTVALSKTQRGCVMRKITTLICVGVISLAGFIVQVQPVQAQSLTDMNDMIRQLATGGTGSVGNIIDNIAGQLMDTGPTGPQVSAIEGPLVVETVIPEVNQTVADVLIGDQRTGRYPPRLKIDFAEFPLVALTPTNGAGNGAPNGRNGRNGASTDVIVQRIQNRFRPSQINLVVEDRVAIVSGTVETEHQRRQVELKLRFEPGIDAVENKITVVP